MLMQAVTPFLIRQFMQGNLDPTQHMDPGMLDQLRKIRARIVRQGIRTEKRDTKARSYIAAAEQGGSKRECTRRMKQIAAGSLRAENGLVREASAELVSS